MISKGTRDYRPTDFALSLRKHMETWCDGMGRRPPMWSRWTDGVYPAYRKLAEQVTVTDSVKLHDYAAHLLSSQTFAFNLFLPFREGNRARLSERMSDLVGAKLSIDKVQFEWVPPGALLGELDGERPVGDEPTTAVDIVLWSRLTDDQRAVVLIEVKLSESGFTKCRGPDHPKNDRKKVCRSSDHFFTDPSACFIRRLPRKQRNRRYWEIFTASHGSVHAAFPGVDMNGPCPFAGHAYQPMRNLAIARGLEQDEYSTVTQAWLALCAHDDNPDAAAHWQAWRELLPDPGMAPSLPASEVVYIGEADGHADWAEWMRNRYRLEKLP